MGDVVTFASLHRSRPPRLPGDLPATGGEVALFPGVRVERWAEMTPPRPDTPSEPVPPRGGRRRRPKAPPGV